ncbi:MAG: hypothetical protein IKR66_07015 [Bacteroidales bacterium]|nr:hypothetical protein [Bacteroidales bacterium]
MGTSFGRWMIFIISMLAIGLCEHAKGQNVTVEDTGLKLYNGRLVNMKKVSQKGVGTMLMTQGAYSIGFSRLVQYAKQHPDTNYTFYLDYFIPENESEPRPVRYSYVPGLGFSIDDCGYYNFDVDILYCQMKLQQEKKNAKW